MQKSRKREKQHYVPQLLLKNFSFKGKGKISQIHAFDKKDNKTFQTGVNNVLAEGKFYDLSLYSAEASFSKLESLIEPVFTKIITEKDISALTKEERGAVSVFVVAQHLRVKSFRTESQEMFQGIIKKFGINQDVKECLEEYLSHSNEDVKDFSLQFIQENLAEMSDYILNKDWHLVETNPNAPFWIGDNPVTMHNENKPKLFSNIGFGVQGIQIYLPLSSTLTLMFWCPSIKAELEESFNKNSTALKDLQVRNVMANEGVSEAINNLSILLEGAAKIIKAINSSKPTLASEENVEFYNSLQVHYAERYILSDKPNFLLAESMINEGVATKKWTLA